LGGGEYICYIETLKNSLHSLHCRADKSHSARALLYDELERICTEAIELSPNGPVVALNIPAGQWHTARALESGTVILEMKDGKFEPTQDCDILKM
jgi:cupin fold WbuC family metalloprotein